MATPHGADCPSSCPPPSGPDQCCIDKAGLRLGQRDELRNAQDSPSSNPSSNPILRSGRVCTRSQDHLNLWKDSETLYESVEDLCAPQHPPEFVPADRRNSAIS